MTRPIRGIIAAAAAALVFTAIPAGASPMPDTSPTSASAAQHDPVDASLRAKTRGDGTVRVNVVTKNRADLPDAATVGKKMQSFDKLPLVTLRVDKGGLDKLAANPRVVSITEDTPVPPTLDQSVPLIGGDKAYAAGKTGAGTSIAILDTGVATKHPFLGNRVKTEACFSVDDATSGATSLCPDGTTEQEGAGSADSESGPCATMGDACSHGTHVAGIAAGDGTGISGAPAHGVAPGADIIAIQVFSRFDDDTVCGDGASPCALSFTSSQIKGLEKVSELKTAGTNVAAVNLSLGAGHWTSECTSDPRKLIIDNLLTQGVATVVAAGNNGYTDAVTAPGCVSSAVTVGATTDDDELASFTNRGLLLDYFAPGTAIVSSVPGGTYASMNGTSMATPHVAGALAILRQAFPHESMADLEARLTNTGKPITYTGATTPRIDIGQALGGSAPEPAPDPKPRPTKVINEKHYSIPDVGTIEAPITVDGVPGTASRSMKVAVTGTHNSRGQVRIDLVAPDGQTYPLKPLSTDGSGALDASYFVDASTAAASGTWKLVVQDTAAGATGTLTSWSLLFANSFEKTGSYLIPDPGTLTSQITVDGFTGKAPGAMRVHIGATHEWLGDLKIDLVGPDGHTYPIRAASPTEAGGTLDTTYTVDASASPADGTWKLLVQDIDGGSRGFLTAWSLAFPSNENQTSHAIPDSGSVDSPISISGFSGNASKELKIHVEARHERRGDLKIQLLDPNGKAYLVKADSAEDTGQTIRKNYTVDAGTSPASGTWKLHVEDVSAGSTGTIDSWTLTF
ncbi:MULTISPECIES: proprotein convertase P-domain-containing protein [unclassified Streptomyces]|uniref:proprotein convertase P-domain-containing protein n=1 Tax=unclassified Streptomyces TaxID=2593676 RepID=UPI000A53F0EA|nr:MULTISPECIES: proprotein convertase P-domain-containing protein [unclassified Streptomyces]